MNPLQYVLTNDKEVLAFLKSRFPVYHMSNIFFRDIQYGIREMFDRKQGGKVNYNEAEKIARELISKLEKEKIFKRIDEQTWLVDYPDYKTVLVKKPAPAKAAPAKPAVPGSVVGGLPPLKGAKPAGGLPPLKSSAPVGAGKPVGGLPPLKSSAPAGAANPTQAPVKTAKEDGVATAETPPVNNASAEKPKTAVPSPKAEAGKIPPLSAGGATRPVLPPIKSSRPAGG